MQTANNIWNYACLIALHRIGAGVFYAEERMTKAYNKAYSALYREEAKARSKAWRAAHREEAKARGKAYYEAHREERKAYREAHREERNAYSRAWNESHPAEMNAHGAAYRAAKSQRTFKSADPKDIEAFYLEAKRLTDETGMKYSVDHIVPLQGKNVSGLHVPWNLQVIPLRDNISKGNR